MVMYEISRKYGDVKKAIAAGAFNIWDDERIKNAFNFGNGTIKDFKRYMDNNKQFCYFRKYIK